MAGMDSKTHKCVEYYLLIKGRLIEKAELIHHWITYGGIQTSLEGEHIIEKLCFSSLIEEQGKGSFQMRREIWLALWDIIFSFNDPAGVINLGDHGLTEAPKSEAWFAKEIILSNNMLFDLPESPKSPYLVKLFLEKNYDLMVVPHSFFECTPVLQVLNLSYTSIKSLPKTISKLVVLRELFLKGCNLLIELPPEISALLNLEVFDIQGTELMCLPEEIGEIVKLKTLRLSFNGRAHLWKENKDVMEIFPRNALLNLSQLNELTIEVFPEGDWWDAEVKAVLDQLWSSSRLITLKLHIPVSELLAKLPYMIYAASKSRFRFIVGRHEQRFIFRMPQKAEEEFNNLEKFQKGLKYINDETIPAEVTYVLEYADAFYLERHWTAKSLSEFGFNKIEGLKFCCLVECNELHTIIDTEKFCQQYNKENTSDKVLKTLALHTCPSLTTIFTLSMLQNMMNLSEITIEDCPKLNSLVSPESPFSESRQFLPSLTKLSLLELPELVSISNGICVAPKLEKMVILFCPKLKLLHSTEVSSEVLKVIKGENEWWDALEWHESDLSTYVEENLASLFVAIDLEGDLMAQLTI